MNDRVEVLPGPGTVLRHGHVAIWAGPTASPALLSFLIQSARNVGESAGSGQQIVDHIAGILATRDPEPGAPFAVIGPTADAWLTLLHGPVQLWDGTQWLAPTPQRTWLRSDVRPRPAVSIGPAGSPSPRLSPDSPYDLRAGTVPGGGLILVPGPPADHAPTSGPAAQVAPYRAPAGVPAGSGLPGGSGLPAGLSPPPAGLGAVAASGPTVRPEAPSPGSPPSEVEGPPGARHWTALRSVAGAAMAALPVGDAVTPPGRPQVAGVRCVRDHFNHPASQVCARCGRSVTPGQPQTVGPRPVLGVLMAADDGTTIRLDVDQVLGSNPATDQGVAVGRLRGVALTGAPGQLAPTHAEIRLSEWTLNIIDRGSAAGTFVVHAGSTGWERLTPYQPVALRPGAHVSIGQRVLTFLSPWPI